MINMKKRVTSFIPGKTLNVRRTFKVIVREVQLKLRLGRSCLTQLLSHIDGLINGADMYLDFTKAFDKVGHKLHIKKLRCLGLDDRVVLWIESFLTDRIEYLRCSKRHSIFHCCSCKRGTSNNLITLGD